MHDRQWYDTHQKDTEYVSKMRERKVHKNQSAIKKEVRDNQNRE